MSTAEHISTPGIQRQGRQDCQGVMEIPTNNQIFILFLASLVLRFMAVCSEAGGGRVVVPKASG